jgi:hypothetical protein
MFNESKLTQIKEVVYTTGSYPELDFMALKYSKLAPNRWVKYNRTRIIYLNLPMGKQPLLVSFSSDKSLTVPVENFVYKLKNTLPNTSFKSLKYLCSFYNCSLMLEKFFKQCDIEIPVLNFITKDTFGWIVYEYQAAYLYKTVTKSCLKDAKEWVYKMNRCDEQTYVASDKIMVSENYSLSKIWTKLTVFGVHPPNYRATSILHSFLMKKDQ